MKEKIVWRNKGRQKDSIVDQGTNRLTWRMFTSLTITKKITQPGEVIPRIDNRLTSWLTERRTGNGKRSQCSQRKRKKERKKRLRGEVRKFAGINWNRTADR